MRATALSLVVVLGGCTGEGSSQPPAADGPGGRFESALYGPVAYPTRVAVGGDGTIYFTDSVSNRVFGVSGGRRVLEISDVPRPLGLAVAGARLYVGSAGRGTVEIYDLARRQFAGTLGGPGAAAMPNSIAVAPDGVVYVCDSRADTVKVWSATGAPLPSIGTSGSGAGQLHFPAAVAVDATRVVVADQGNHRVQVFDRQGQLVRAFGGELPEKVTSNSDFAGRFTRVQSVALSGDDIYVLDSYHAHIQVFDAAGVSKGFLGEAGSCETCFLLGLDLAFTAPGELVVTDPQNHRFVRLPSAVRWVP